MLSKWCIRWLGFTMILGWLNIQHTRAIWPLSNTSSVQLVGLFSDAQNTSTPDNSSVHSRAMFQAAVILSQLYNIKINGQYLGWQAIQTGGDFVSGFRSTCQALTNSDIIGIVGPAFSREADVIAPFAQTIGIPTISYSATNPDLSDRNSYPAFYRTVPSDAAAAVAVVQLFLRYNWTSCIIIYQNDAFGSGGVEIISDRFNQNNLVVTGTIVFDIVTERIRGDLKSILFASPTRIVIVWADTPNTLSILQNALDADVLGPHFTWILSSNVPLTSFNQTSYSKVVGILTLEPVVANIVDAPFNATLLNAAYQIWQQYEPETFPGATQINYYALFAFDATWIFIQSLQELCSMNTNNSSSCTFFVENSFCFDRRFLNATALFDIISRTEFLGVSGPVKFSTNVTDRTEGIYYIIRNTQLTTNSIQLVPVLQWSQSDDWNTYTPSSVVIWPGSTLVAPPGFAGLEGINLRICTIESMPFTMEIDASENNQTQLIGYIPDLIALLQTKLGFIAQIIPPVSDQTYGGLVQKVANGICDVAIGDVTVTSKRREIVDFSASIFDNSIRIIIRQSMSDNLDLFSYLKPFSFNLWLTLLGCTLYSGLLFCIMERQDNEALQNRGFMSSSTMSVWFSIGNIMGYGVDFDVRSAGGRVLTVGLYLLSIVLVATYTANLASGLTISKSKSIISGIDDIKNGKIPYSRIGIIVQSSWEDYYLQEVSRGIRNYYPLQTQDELYSKLASGIIDASFMDIGVAEYVTNNIYCNLTLVGSDFGQSAYGIVMPKNWLYKSNLDVVILALREDGTLDGLKTKWFENNICQDTSSSDSSDSINVLQMSGLFVTFAAISILSLLVSLWQNRFIIKDYLLKLRDQKYLSNEEQINEIGYPIQIPSTHKDKLRLSSYENTKI